MFTKHNHSENISNKCVVFVGCPGAGKTTFAREVAKTLHMVLVDRDTISSPIAECILPMLGEETSDLDSPVAKKVSPAFYTAAEKVVVDNLVAGLNCVLVAPYTQRNTLGWRENLAERLNISSADLLVLWVDVDFTVIRDRLAKRGLPRDENTLKTWERFIMLTTVEPPDGTHVYVSAFAPSESVVEIVKEWLDSSLLSGQEQPSHSHHLGGFR